MYICRYVLVFCKRLKVYYNQVFVFVCTQVYMFACTQVYEFECAHKCMCPGGVGGGTCLPSRCNPTSVCKCSPQVLKWRRRRACTVIRFQWGHRRIRTGKSRDMSLGHLVCSTSQQLSEVPPAVISLSSCRISRKLQH